MKVSELVKLIQEEGAQEIEFEDYHGNTICHLSDLDYADSENTVIRLQMCEKPGIMSPLKEVQENA